MVQLTGTALTGGEDTTPVALPRTGVDGHRYGDAAKVTLQAAATPASYSSPHLGHNMLPDLVEPAASVLILRKSRNILS